MFTALSKFGLAPMLSLFFKVGLLAFTGWNTYYLLLDISGDPTQSLIGMVLFEGALIYWWHTFKSEYEPTVPQMAISFTMFIMSLLLVLAMSALAMSAVDRTVLGPHTVERVIVAAVGLNLASSMLYSIFGFHLMQQLIQRIVAGMVWAKANMGLFNQVDSMSKDLTVDLTRDTYASIDATVRRNAERSLSDTGRPRPILPAASRTEPQVISLAAEQDVPAAQVRPTRQE